MPWRTVVDADAADAVEHVIRIARSVVAGRGAAAARGGPGPA
jgi:hypothetical protein